MKNLLLVFFTIIFATFDLFGQCTIDPYIQTWYTRDAHVLALREIISDPSHPDFDNPYPSADLATSYLERLTALYENPHNNPNLDDIFNRFRIQANEEYNFQIEFNKIIFSADTSLPWIAAFKNTGISGIPALDNLMSTHHFTILSFFDGSSCSCTYFTLVTITEYMNLYALEDDFLAINDIDYSQVDFPGWSLRFNYIGDPYFIAGFPVEACDIIVDGDSFRFVMYAGDCPAGCQESESRYAFVNEACEILGTEDFSVENFNIYPIPAQNELYFEGLSSEVVRISVFSMLGEVMLELPANSEKIDISNLSAGMYFLTAETSHHKKIIKKFIKH